ncbi:MAG: hypothetical protein IANPNBLG_00993 [Bryobacteraceae bacterium]|nr:hypothetical protein [Bryobacteraceae bacterium]
MACYISSRDNRFYVAVEQQFGAAAEIAAANRFPATTLSITQEAVLPKRLDKTGSRTYLGNGAPFRTSASFALKSYMAANAQNSGAPCQGPLFESALGGGAQSSPGGVVESIPVPGQIRFLNPHGLTTGQGLAFGGEIRFAAAVLDDRTVRLNAPFTILPAAGSILSPTTSYSLSKNLKSVTICDYWSPESAVQRIACGAVVDRLKIAVNGDYHELEFRGPAAELVDSASFVSGLGSLTTFPAEPATGALPAPVPGHLGQAWIGAAPDQFFTLTEASLSLDNNVDMRAREFGSIKPRCFAPGTRSLTFRFAVFARDDVATSGLYVAAKQAAPVEVMLQLGQQPGQLMGIYMRSVVLPVPVFDDREPRLEWRFDGCLARGQAEDELYVAFG